MEFCVLFYAFHFATGEGKLISKDGSIYEGSFHNHRRHGEGKWMFRLADELQNLTQAQLCKYVKNNNVLVLIAGRCNFIVTCIQKFKIK